MAMPRWFAPALAITTAIMVLSGIKAAHGSESDTVTVEPGKLYRFHALAHNVTADNASKIQASLTLVGATDVSVVYGSGDTADIEYTATPVGVMTYTMGRSFTIAGVSVELLSVKEV